MQKKIYAWFITCGLLLWLVPVSLGNWSSSKSTEPLVPDLSMVFMNEEDYRAQLIQDTITDYNRRLDSPTQTRIIQEILEASVTSELDPFLVTAVIAAESSFRPHAVSPCGARGLMQLTRIVQPSLGVSNPFDIAQNIHGGCTFLAELHRRFGDTTLALAAYNAGPTRVARLKRVPRIRETQRYIVKVQKIAALLYERLLQSINAYRTNPVSFLQNLAAKKPCPILRDSTKDGRDSADPGIPSGYDCAFPSGTTQPYIEAANLETVPFKIGYRHTRVSKVIPDSCWRSMLS